MHQLEIPGVDIVQFRNQKVYIQKITDSWSKGKLKAGILQCCNVVSALSNDTAAFILS